MGEIVVGQFVTLDGVVEDPDGTTGMDGGGWAFLAGPNVFAGDKFALTPILEDGALLLGRSTWDLFAGRWPARSGGFADTMNEATKVVVSSRPVPVERWSGSVQLEGDLIEGVRAVAADRDVAVAGSASVIHQLAAADLIDEYRLLTIPASIGHGTPLFARPAQLELVSSEPTEIGPLARYRRRSPAAA